ncbi:hypothetical protein [Streptomyces canus]|uniref:hypothetical protein n=1 Tax=Streptomyces canus TaxID=58343 RepID=UPI002E2AC7B1|nr:hypothetical protein [Streptomyces canus]
MAERLFTELTGRTDYSREASMETLSVVLTAVAAEDQAGYPAQLEDFAARNRGRRSCTASTGRAANSPGWSAAG